MDRAHLWVKTKVCFIWGKKLEHKILLMKMVGRMHNTARKVHA